MVEILWELSVIDVANPTELDNQNAPFLTELKINGYNTTVDVFIRIADI